MTATTKRAKNIEFIFSLCGYLIVVVTISITHFDVAVNAIVYLQRQKVTNVNERGGYNDNFVSRRDRKAA